MIASLRGKALFLKPGYVLLETESGIGFEIITPVSAFSEIQQQKDHLFLYTALRIKDDAVNLYGFLKREEIFLFEKLTSVSGVGPKIAISLISALGTQNLINAINEGNLSRIKGIPGIGIKTAQRIILELTGKLKLESDSETFSQVEDDLVSALINLGYQAKLSREIVEAVLNENKDEADFSNLLRKCLKKVAR